MNTLNLSQMANQTVHINARSDFKLAFRFKDVDILRLPWKITFTTRHTPPEQQVIASFDGLKYENCKPLDTGDGVIVIFNDHQIEPGVLLHRLEAALPDDIFPDNKMDVFVPTESTIQLWDKASDNLEITPEIILITQHALRGYSAYEIAVQNGYAGSESEWLEGLRGEKGDTGDVGNTGNTGAVGPKGDKGDTGDVGSQGIQGLLGPKGDTGSTGAVGPKGDKGDTGIQGKPGVDAQIVETIPGVSVVLDLVGGHTYICGELTSLVIRTVEDSPRSAVVRFRSGAVATTLTLPDTLRIAGYARPEVNRDYELDIASRLAVINRF